MARRPVNPRLGIVLEASRVSLGLSVRGAAKSVGVTPAFLWRIEQGQRGMSAATAAEVSRVYRLGEYERDLLAAEIGE